MRVGNRKKIFLALAGLSLAILPQLAEAAGNPYFTSLASRVLIYAIAAVSLDLLLGFSGMVSLGHAAYLGLGAYTVGILQYHAFEGSTVLNWPISLAGSNQALLLIPLAMLSAALAGLIFGALSLRTRGMHFIMITLAFAQMLYYFFVSLENYGGDDGLSLYSRFQLPHVDLADDRTFYYLCLSALAIWLLLSKRLVKSRFGLVLRAAGDNERRLSSLGVHPYRYQLTCFVIAAAGAGLAGALLANHTEYVSPGLLHWTMSGELMVMVLLGGLGSLYGPVLGAATYLLLEHLLTMHTEHWMAYFGPFLILVVVLLRRGLYGLFSLESHHEK